MSLNTSRNAVPNPSIVCLDREHFDRQLELIYSRLEQHGYVVLKAWNAEQETYIELARHFGRIQHHPKADRMGVVRVTPERAKSGDENFDRNVSKTSEEFFLHTDGSFVNGLCFSDEKMFRVSPPVLFLLQCVQPATEGGVNVLVDAQKVLLDLWQNHPAHARILSTQSAMSYFGGDQVAIDFPLFEERERGRWRIRFRWDLGFAKPWAVESVRCVINEYFLNPAYQVRHKLESGEILVVDNQRLLHGRDAIVPHPGEPARLLRRIWIWDEMNEEVAALSNTGMNAGAYAALSSHRPLSTMSESARKRWLELGIQMATENAAAQGANSHLVRA